LVTTAFDEHERLRWAGRAPAYQRSFAPLCGYPAGALLDAAGVGPGCRVLDAGTGPGTVAALAADRGARVVAVDAEASMVAAARQRVRAAEVRHAVLPVLPFAAGSFDAAVANFVINHLGDPSAGLAALARVVCPGGRVAVTIWPNPRPPLQQLFDDAFEAAGAERPAAFPAVTADKNFARTADGLAGLLRGAGLTGVRCDTISWVHRADLEDWWSGPANGIGMLGVLMQGQPASVISRIRSQYDRLVEPHLDADGIIAAPTAALLASGTVPAGRASAGPAA
jgi:SAM-dependent methyltransferase